MSNEENEEVYHVPVLLNEVIEGLAIKPDGVYVDCTFGGGGHSKEILKRLNEKGRLIAFDQDADAQRNLPDDPRVLFLPHNFKHLHRFWRLHKIPPVDGLLADLGVSSHQFDEAERGFSIRFDAPMDMRMDARQELTAYDVLMQKSETELHKMFEQYGEVTNAKTLAKTIVDIRKTVSLKTIQNFKQALSGIVKGNPNKYFAQVFQALRIEVNDELGVLKDLLQQLPLVMNTGGRVAIITFHSLEDRIVKNYFKRGDFEDKEDVYDLYGGSGKSDVFRLVNKKPIVATKEELRLNSRSRSAKLRIAEKL